MMFSASWRLPELEWKGVASNEMESVPFGNKSASHGIASTKWPPMNRRCHLCLETSLIFGPRFLKLKQPRPFESRRVESRRVESRRVESRRVESTRFRICLRLTKQRPSSSLRSGRKGHLKQECLTVETAQGLEQHGAGAAPAREEEEEERRITRGGKR